MGASDIQDEVNIGDNWKFKYNKYLDKFNKNLNDKCNLK